MALSVSNVVTPKQTALNNKVANPFASGLSINSTGGVVNTSTPVASTTQNSALTPGQFNNSAPVSNASTPGYSNMVASSGASSPGAYKGVAITPGDQASIQAQMAKIDGTGSQNTSTPPINTPTTQPYSMSNTSTKPDTSYGGLVGSLVQNANSGSPVAGQAASGLVNLGQNNSATTGPAFDAYTKAIADQQKLKSGIAAQYGNIESQAIPLEFQQGREQALSRQYASQLDAAHQAVNQQQQGIGYQISGNQAQQSALNSAGGLGNTAQGLLQSGLTSAVGAAQPIQVPYSNQLVNPQNGQPVSGGISGSLQDAVSTVVQRVQSGQMSYDQAVQALGGYGQGGVNALQQALGPNFSVAQSNELAGQQGQIGPAFEFAKSALTNLQNLATKLGTSGAIPGQGSNIPIINSLANLGSSLTGVGGETTRQYQQAVAEARNSYAQLLAASRGGTPTDYGNQATTAIPDNATPNDIQAAINSLESLGQSKLNTYGNPGAVNQRSNTSSSSNGQIIQTPYGAINPTL